MSSNTKAVSTTSVISDATAIDALCDMSRRRGLHAARTEVEQTWKTVAGKNFEEKLCADRKSNTSEIQSLMRISYAVCCWTKKTLQRQTLLVPTYRDILNMTPTTTNTT